MEHATCRWSLQGTGSSQGPECLLEQQQGHHGKGKQSPPQGTTTRTDVAFALETLNLVQMSLAPYTLTPSRARVANLLTCSCCFQVVRHAFTYNWRLWTIPDLVELLKQAGFKEVHIWVKPLKVRPHVTSNVGATYAGILLFCIWPAKWPASRSVLS